MSLYKYKASDEYKDWGIIKKNNIIIHDGSFISFIDYEKGEVKLNINHGLEESYPMLIKKIKEFYVTVPKDPECLKIGYRYCPCVFTEEQLKEIIRVGYLDYNNIQDVSSATSKDILNAWIYTCENCEMELRMIDISRKVVAFSDGNNYMKTIENILHSEEYEIKKINDNMSIITAYVDINNYIIEWDCILKNNDNVFMRLDEDFCIQYF